MTDDVLTGRSLRSADHRARRPSLPAHRTEAASKPLHSREAWLELLGRRLIVLTLVAGAILLTPVLVGLVADLFERARSLVPWLLAQLRDVVAWAGGWLIPVLVGLLAVDQLLGRREEDG